MFERGPSSVARAAVEFVHHPMQPEANGDRFTNQSRSGDFLIRATSGYRRGEGLLSKLTFLPHGFS